MSPDRVNNAEADEDGGGGDEEYEVNSLGEPVRTGLQGRSRHMNTRN